MLTEDLPNTYTDPDFLLRWSGTKSAIAQANTGLLSQPRMMTDDAVWHNGWNAWQRKPKCSDKTCPSAALSTTNPTWPETGSNLGHCGVKPRTNRLSYGTTTYRALLLYRNVQRHEFFSHFLLPYKNSVRERICVASASVDKKTWLQNNESVVRTASRIWTAHSLNAFLMKCWLQDCTQERRNTRCSFEGKKVPARGQTHTTLAWNNNKKRPSASSVYTCYETKVTLMVMCSCRICFSIVYVLFTY
jgi:hypothetical protein